MRVQVVVKFISATSVRHVENMLQCIVGMSHCGDGLLKNRVRSDSNDDSSPEGGNVSLLVGLGVLLFHDAN